MIQLQLLNFGLKYMLLLFSLQPKSPRKDQQPQSRDLEKSSKSTNWACFNCRDQHTKNVLIPKFSKIPGIKIALSYLSPNRKKPSSSLILQDCCNSSIFWRMIRRRVLMYTKPSSYQTNSMMFSQSSSQVLRPFSFWVHSQAGVIVSTVDSKSKSDGRKKSLYIYMSPDKYLPFSFTYQLGSLHFPVSMKSFLVPFIVSAVQI